jgi:hypothetical protein
LKAFRLMLARKLFEAGLWKLEGFVLRDGDVLFLNGGATLVFRHEGRVESRKGTRVR